MDDLSQREEVQREHQKYLEQLEAVRSENLRRRQERENAKELEAA